MTNTIGFVGLGAMGQPMTHRLLAAGHRVNVWGRTRARLEPAIAAGASRADSLQELVSTTDVIVGCLLDDAAVEAVYFDAHGIGAHASPGQIFVEHATFSPALARKTANVLGDKGAVFLDVPITGGPDGARNGTLIGMAGGESAAINQVQPLLSAYLREIHHMGAVGTGLELKLINQLLVSIHFLASAEAASLIERLDIDPDHALQVLTGGWASSAMLKRTLPLSLQGAFEGRGATIGGLIEVQRHVAELVARAEVDSVLLSPTRGRFAEAAASLGDADPAALVSLALRKEAS